MPERWTPDSWRNKPIEQVPDYPDRQALSGPGGGPALVLRGLAKDFGGRPVVDRIDLDVPVGSFFGLVGPNGAGKTTTLSMVTGLLRRHSQ